MQHILIVIVSLGASVTLVIWAWLQVVSVHRQQHIQDVARSYLAWRPKRRRPRRRD